jgi:hypothetical protein
LAFPRSDFGWQPNPGHLEANWRNVYHAQMREPWRWKIKNNVKEIIFYFMLNCWERIWN